MLPPCFRRRIAVLKLNKLVLVFLCVAGVTLFSFGCGDDSSPSSPAAPSAFPAALASTDSAVGVSVRNAIDTTSLGTDTVDLKATAATPLSPINNVEVDDFTPTLTAANASGTFRDATFSYVFAVFNVTGGGSTLVETATRAQGATSTSFQIQAPLEGDSSYQWRVRPFLDGAFGPWSTLASFTTPPSVVIGLPVPTAPINGATVSDLRPDFNVTNGSVEGDAGTVIYQIQVALDSGFSNIVTEEGTELRAQGDTNIHLRADLAAETHYFWRVRGRNDGQGKTGFLPIGQATSQVIGDWSTTQDFFTPAALPPGPTPFCCPPPNRLEIVQQVGDETGYPDSGISVTDFTQAVAQRLNQEDPNWGRRINGNGNIGKDTIGYRVDGSDDNPYKVDIVAGATSSSPVLHWAGEGRLGGSWVAP